MHHRIIAGIALAAILTGCQQAAIDTATIAAELAYLDREADRAAETLDRLVLPVADRATLDAALADIAQVRRTVRAVIDQHGTVEAALVYLPDFAPVISHTRGAYLKARAVVETYRDRLPPWERIELEQIDRAAGRLDAALERLATATGTETASAVLDALRLAATLARLAAAL